MITANATTNGQGKTISGMDLANLKAGRLGEEKAMMTGKYLSRELSIPFWKLQSIHKFNLIYEKIKEYLYSRSSMPDLSQEIVIRYESKKNIKKYAIHVGDVLFCVGTGGKFLIKKAEVNLDS
jgi:hypothetical protein